MPGGQDLHPIPVVLLSDFLRHTQRILEHTVAAKQVVVTIRGRIHHQMSLKRKRPFVFSDGFAPERNAGVHFTCDQTALKDQSKVLVSLFRQQVRAGLRCILLRVPPDDNAVFDGEVIVRESIPAIKVPAVEQ